MGSTQSETSGPDLTKGIAATDLADGSAIAGHVGGDAVTLARSGNEYFAVSAACTHYGGPLADGLIVGDTVRCPWHHACFSLRTGEALRTPAFNSLDCWVVEQKDGKVYVKSKKTVAERKPISSTGLPKKVVIVGGGAAGFAAAEMLRRVRYDGSIVMLSNDDAAPVDRPNLSKDYLAGSAPEDWVPLRPDSYYAENNIDLRLNSDVTGIDTRAHEVVLNGGSRVSYDRLLLATGAEPVRLPLPGADLPHVHTLRSLKDCRAIIENAKAARRAVVVGASFIGLEVAASLRTRNIEVHVVAPEKIPMERVMGPELGAFIRSLHEEHGVIFHLEDVPAGIDANKVRLKSGGTLEADLVVVGVGVRPRTELAEKAGLSLNRGIAVNEYLETSVPGIFAAGDIARWPDRLTGENIRVEHWVVAERQGQTAALNLLGQRQKFDSVPFFWSQHYDVPINYVGHAEKWDKLDIDGDIKGRDCVLRYKKNGRVFAVSSIYRDRDSLLSELTMERSIAA